MITVMIAALGTLTDKMKTCMTVINLAMAKANCIALLSKSSHYIYLTVFLG